ncbi:glycerol-3-phosphate cytidylyltransferase [Pseudoalteromonas sp. SG44-5]|uniref:glycerol-3-phosphate cytidylyltransferase n=1 Tax=Pseudoalteromonas sp. SG44-5 TaxID=2760960 RepID=UPI0015F9425D|nr:glycerol-3-phosphate cytidylyltransferase [Pseudoalteromonas sp. SG44-5]MBB1406061.1 glycerol-3-phosphate cytidylyltransferase [Pseudoalteromonas sp. SG44-5]
MKVILTYGTFDLFHVGHVRLLERLASLGDKLIVGLSSDEFNKSKGKSSFFSYEERAEILAACKYVDLVIPEREWEQKESDINKYNVDIFAMGDDWKGHFDSLSSLCQVVYLPRTKSISTSEIKTLIADLKKNDLNKVQKSLNDAIEIIKKLNYSE